VVLKGTGFSPYIRPAKSTRALQAAEKLIVLKGHDFSRAVTTAKSTGPLGPEGWFLGSSDQVRPFSAACLAPEGRLDVK